MLGRQSGQKPEADDDAQRNEGQRAQIAARWPGALEGNEQSGPEEGGDGAGGDGRKSRAGSRKCS
jgi:hypothetical protein